MVQTVREGQVQNVPLPALPCGIESANDLQNLVTNFPSKCENAIREFTKLVLEMTLEEISFSQVKIEVGGEIQESPFSDFYRSFAIMEKMVRPDWKLLSNEETIATFYIERILELGNAREVDMPLPTFPRKTPSAFGDYKTQTYVRKLPEDLQN